MKIKIVIILVCLMGFVPLTAPPFSPCNAGEMAVIKVKYRMVSELLPVVEGILASEGTVTADGRTNALVVIAEPEAILRVRRYLDRFDKPPEQVRIHVRFRESGTEKERSISASGGISDDQWRISTGRGPKDGVHVQAEDRHRQHRGTSDYFVMAASGSPAYIRTGISIPYHDRWIRLTRRHARAAHAVSYQEVDTGFDVTPVILGNQALLKIVPRISHGSTQTDIIRFHAARTEIRVPLGKWVDFGGVAGERNDVVREILARGGGQNSDALRMSLMVERYEPPRK